MIYIDDDNRTLVIQKTVVSDDNLTLQLRNTMARFSKTFNVQDTSENPWLYQIELTSTEVGGLPNGEYTMTLLAGTTVVGYGLMRKVKRFDADNVYSNVQPDTVYGDNMDYTYHTVSISASLGGYLIVNGQVYQTYNESVREGRILTVQAVPGEHYTFDSWSDGVEDNPRTITVTEDITLAATYETMEYTVSISAGSDGSVSVNGVQGDYQATLQYGTVLTLEADGDTGYGFTQWSDGNTDNPRELVVGGDITLTAAFAIGMYQVTVTAGQNGTISVNGIPGNYSQTVSYGTQLVLEATPSSGYDFTEWSDGNSDNPRTLTVTGPVTLASSYAAESYAVSIVSEDTAEGNVIVNGATGDYSHNVAYGTTLTISVSPSQHYSFVMWSDGIISGTRTVTVTGPLTLTAVFAIDTYNVSITSGSNGYVSVNGVIGDYTQVLPYGTVLAIEADPNTGYNFNQWSDGSTTASRSVTVTGDLTLSASFAVQTFSVSISAGQDGSVSVNGTPGDYSATVDYGTVLTATATADQDYEFMQWSDGDTSNPRTITVTSDVTLSAAFQVEVQPSKLNTIYYTTTNGQVNSSWLTAYDENNNVLTPVETSHYGRIVYGEPVVSMYIQGYFANNIESITTGYKVANIRYNNLTSMPNCTRLVLKSPYLQFMDFALFNNLQYIESWHANDDAAFAGLDQLPTTGTCVTRTDNNLWEHSDLSGWTFQALGTTFTYEAQQMAELSNMLNRKGYVNVVSHTFDNGVGTVVGDGTIGEFRDGWSGGFDKIYWPDTVGYVDYNYGWYCDVELGEYAGVVGGGQYAPYDWNYQHLFNSGIRPDCTVTVKSTNPILEIGTDGCIYNKEDWMGLYVAGQTLDSNNYIAELDMDDRCVDASTCMLGGMCDTGDITRLVLGDSCQSLKLYERVNYSEFSVRVGELVLNDALRSINPNREYITHASGGSNNPYLNVINNGYAIESEDGTTLYWCGDASVDLSGYTVFAESCCGELYFSSMPNISSATQVDRNAFTDVSGVSTWVWPNNTVTFNGSHCLKSNDVTRMEFSTHAPVFNNNDWEGLFQLGNISTLVFNSTTLPTQSDQNNPLFQELPQNGTVYIPVGSDYTTWLNYPGNINNIGQWTVKYIMDNNQIAIKHTPGVTITAPTITGLSVSSSVDNNGWLVVTYSGNVTSFDNTDLQNNTDVLEVVLPDTCLSVGNGAFLGCSNLSKVAVSDNCTTIGNSAFYGTAITEFTTQGVTNFGSEAFGSCSSLERVDFGENLATLGNGLFNNCTSLNEINFAAVNGPTIANNDLGSGIHATGTMYIPMYANFASYSDFINAMPSGWTVVRRKNNQILYQTNNSQALGTVPESMYGASLVRHVYDNGWGVIEYDGSSIYSIDNYAFYSYNDLTYISLPRLERNISSNAFESCGNLATVEIQDCTDIDWNAFRDCPIANGPDTGKLTLPPSVGYIWGGAFNNLASSVIEFGPALHSIDTDTFNLQNATDLWVYTTNTMEDQGNPFTNVPASGTLHMVPGADTAYWTKYLSGWTVVQIQPDDEIWYASSDNNIVTPNDSTAFGNAAIISNAYSNGKGVIKFDKNLTTVGYEAFKNCTTLASILIPKKVTSIGTRAFHHCTELTSANIPDTVTTLGNEVFASTDKLISITIPDSVTSMGYHMFAGCSDLASATIGNGVTAIGNQVFSNCFDLASVTLPSGLTSIEFDAFFNCRSLTSITIPNTVTSIEHTALRGCQALTAVSIPSNVVTIGNDCFRDCTLLSSITFNSTTTVPTIGTNVFMDVASTGTVYGQAGLDYSDIMAALPSGWSLSQ